MTKEQCKQVDKLIELGIEQEALVAYAWFMGFYDNDPEETIMDELSAESNYIEYKEIKENEINNPEIRLI